MSLKPNKTDRMRQLLREGDYTGSELARAADVQPSSACRLINIEIKNGNVEVVAKRAVAGRSYPAYAWCGDDDLLTCAIRAAEYLRDNATDNLGKSISRHLFRLTEIQS